MREREGSAAWRLFTCSTIPLGPMALTLALTAAPLILVALVMTPLADIAAAADVPLQDAHLLMLDRALGGRNLARAGRGSMLKHP